MGHQISNIGKIEARMNGNSCERRDVELGVKSMKVTRGHLVEGFVVAKLERACRM